MDLKTVLPPDYENNVTMIELQDILSSETDRAEQALSRVLNERFIDTAVETLPRREAMYGIKNAYGDAASDIEKRRRIIKAKLRGRGTLTKEALRDYVKTFLDPGDSVTIIEHNDIYSVFIEIPWNSKITQEYTEIIFEYLREVVPAHLGIEFFVSRDLNMQLFTGSIMEAYSEINIDNAAINKDIDVSMDQYMGMAYFDLSEISLEFKED